MNKFLMLMVSACFLTFTACKDTSCDTIKPFVDQAGTAFAAAMTCSNPAAVQADLLKMCGKAGICKDMNTVAGPWASMLCPVLVPLLVNVASKELPPAWGCTGTASASVLTAACTAIPL